MNKSYYGWTRTDDHVRIAQQACVKSCCFALGIKQLVQECPAPACLLISSNEEARTNLSVDCAAYHFYSTFTTDNTKKSAVVVRCIGLTPDTLLSRHLHSSILRELELIDKTQDDDGPTSSQLHWVERLGRLLPTDTFLTLILAGIDQLVDFCPFPAQLPDNIQLVATSCRQPDSWPLAVHSPVPSKDPPTLLDDFFHQLEVKFSKESVTQVVFALSFGPVTEAELKEVSAPDLSAEDVSSLLESLEPVLIRWSFQGEREEEGEEEEEKRTIILMSRPALVHVQQRYAASLERRERVAAQFTLIPSRLLHQSDECLPDSLGWIARLFLLTAFEELKRDRTMATLFDWKAWNVSCQSGPLAIELWSAIIRRAASNFMDSQLWLLEHNLSWIERADVGIQHVAAQLSVAIKPFAEKGSSNGYLWQLYQGAQVECDQFAGSVLVAPALGWNWNHCATPLEKSVKVDVVSEIQLLCATPDGQVLVVVTGDAIDPFRSLSAVTGRKIAAYNKGHSGRVTCVHVTDDSRNVISGSEDLTVIIWHLLTGNLILRIREHIATVSCVSSVLASRMVVSGGEDSILMAVQWPGQGERLARIDHHRGPVTALAINYRQDVLVSGSQDGSICLWSLEDWSLLNLIVVGQPVGHITLSTDDVFLLAVGLDDSLPRLFSLTTGSSLRTWNDLPFKVTGAVIVGGNGHSLAGFTAEDGRLMCYDCHGGHLLHALSINGSTTENKKRNAFCSRTNDPRLLYHSVGKALKVWMLRYEEKRQTGNMNIVTCLAASPLDGSVVVTGDRNGCVQLWRTSNLSRIAQWTHPTSVSVVNFDATGLFVSSGAEDGSCAVWNLDAGQTLPPTQVHTHRVNQLITAADWNAYALSCDSAENVVQWKLTTGEIVRQWTLTASKLLSLAKNAKWMAGSCGTNSVRLWSLEAGEETKEVTVSHTEEILCLTLTSDSRYLITGSKDSSLKMWEGVEKGGKLVQIMAGHSDHVTAVVSALVSSLPGPSSVPTATKNLVVVSGSRDGQLIIWDAQHGCEIHSEGMKRHRGAVTCLKVSTDGSVLVSGSEDGTVSAWNLRLGTSLSSFVVVSPVRQIAIAPDASKIWVRLHKQPLPAILDLRHTPAVLIKPEVVATQKPSPVSLRKPPPTRRLLKKEISLDSYTWLKRYGPKSTSSNVIQPTQQPVQAPSVTPSPSTDPHSKLSRRNSFCNVPETNDDA